MTSWKDVSLVMKDLRRMGLTWEEAAADMNDVGVWHSASL